MSRKRLLKVIEGFGSVALAVLLVLPLYEAQELLAALILFSIGCAAIALLGLALFLIDALGRTLFRKLQDAARACATFAHRSLVLREGLGQESPFVFRWAEIAPDIDGVTRRLTGIASRFGNYW